MQAYNIEPQVFDESCLTADELQYIDQYREQYFGKEFYPAFSFNRETISNANEEQLWAFYNVYNSMNAINIENKVPSSTQEPEM